MKNVFCIFLAILVSLFFSGCFGKEPQKAMIHTVNIQQEIAYTDLEKEIVKIAEENNRKYNEYTEILTQMKSKTRLYKNSKIPKRMARRVTFIYDGPALSLLKTIAEETQYHLDISNSRILDSKNISRKYVDSMLIDILYDIVDSSLMTINIDERDELIKIMEK